MMRGFIDRLCEAKITNEGYLSGTLMDRDGEKNLGLAKFRFSHIVQIGDELLGFTSDDPNIFLLINFDMDSYRQWILDQGNPKTKISIDHVIDRDMAERVARRHMEGEYEKMHIAGNEEFVKNAEAEGDKEFLDYLKSPDGSGPFEKASDDGVDHPGHYGGDTVYEVIKCLEAWFTPEMYIGACRGQAIIYLARADKKEDPTKDLNKASKYIEFEVDFRQRMKTGNVGNERAILMEFLSKMDSNELIDTIEFWEHRHR
jgi:hypothetical protein